jgi:cytochrome b6-f complex iron-sulfur subunit
MHRQGMTAGTPTRRTLLCSAAGCFALAACERAGASAVRAAPASVAPSSGPPSAPPFASSLGSPSGAGSTAERPPLARSAQVSAGSPLPVSLPDGRPGFLIRVSDDVVLLDGTCTHAACAVTWKATGKVFLCPCHLSRFDRAGRVVNPPATDPLPRIPVVERDGSVFLA